MMSLGLIAEEKKEALIMAWIVSTTEVRLTADTE